MYFFETTRPY